MMEKVIAWLYSLLLAFIAVMTENMTAVIFACALAISLVVVDFITGIAASLFREGGKIESKKLRWSFAKAFVYVIVVVGTLAIGVFLHLIETFITPSNERTTILFLTLTCVKYEAFVVAWIESVSNVENLMRLFPGNKLLKYVHFVLSVDFIKKIPKLADSLKEKETKNLNDQNNG